MTGKDGLARESQKEQHRLGTMGKWDPPEANWVAKYYWTRYRGLPPYPVPGGWVLGIVEADGTGWHYYGDAGVGEARDTDLDPDDKEGSAVLINEIVDPNTSNSDEPDLEWRIEVDCETVFRRVGASRESLYEAVAEALDAYDANELDERREEIVPSTGRKPDDIRDREERERRREENESLGDFA